MGEEQQCQPHNIHNGILLLWKKSPENEPKYAICCDSTKQLDESNKKVRNSYYTNMCERGERCWISVGHGTW